MLLPAGNGHLGAISGSTTTLNVACDVVVFSDQCQGWSVYPPTSHGTVPASTRRKGGQAMDWVRCCVTATPKLSPMIAHVTVSFGPIAGQKHGEEGQVLQLVLVTVTP